MSDLAWSSALSPQAPSIPRTRDWSLGIMVSLALATAAGLWFTGLDHSVAGGEEEVEERVVVALGGSAAKKLEAPPPPKDAPVTDTPPPLAERAKDADPIAAPPEPRAVQTWTQGVGDYSSGTGGKLALPSPPAPPKPAPSPPPPPEPQVSQQFIRISTAQYSRLVVYPDESLAKNEEGVGDLLITMERDGTVVKWELVGSTGFERLDNEVRRIARKVKTLEALPDDFPSRQVRFLIHITFKIARD
jgi:TonB family protein